jgi:hypothetical protein
MTQDTTQQIPATMRAFAIDRFGELGSLRELPTPTIGADEMLVRVRAVGVNPIDWKIRDGFKAIEDASFPFILGQDAAGVGVRAGVRGRLPLARALRPRHDRLSAPCSAEDGGKVSLVGARRGPGLPLGPDDSVRVARRCPLARARPRRRRAQSVTGMTERRHP